MASYPGTGSRASEEDGRKGSWEREETACPAGCSQQETFLSWEATGGQEPAQGLLTAAAATTSTSPTEVSPRNQGPRQDNKKDKDRNKGGGGGHRKWQSTPSFQGSPGGGVETICLQAGDWWPPTSGFSRRCLPATSYSSPAPLQDTPGSSPYRFTEMDNKDKRRALLPEISQLLLKKAIEKVPPDWWPPTSGFSRRCLPATSYSSPAPLQDNTSGVKVCTSSATSTIGY